MGLSFQTSSNSIQQIPFGEPAETKLLSASKFGKNKTI